MAKTLISYPTFLGTPLPARSRHGLLHTLPTRRLISTTVKMSLQDIPPVSSIDLSSIVTRAESALYTLADAAVAVGSASGGAASSSGDEAVQKSGGWFGFISDAMEFVLKILEDGLTAVHVPYAYGFSIILLTVLVKLATLPLTKQQASET
ncbi:Inner membrane protein ALBINO3, chloroplastic [Linum perenne]